MHIQPFLHLNEFVKPVQLKTGPDRTPIERVFMMITDHDGVTIRDISERLNMLENTTRSCIHRLYNEGSIKRLPPTPGERRQRWIAGMDERVEQKVEKTYSIIQRTVSEWEPVKVPQQNPFSALFKEMA